MNYRSVASNVLVALTSQGISLLASIMTSFLVPKLLGVEEFGYWQLFIFYSSYVGFFHLGLCDGVYLINGGQSRESIDKQKIKSELFFLLAYQLLFALLIIFVSSIFINVDERKFVVFSTALFLCLNNVSIYIGYVFQAINETKLYSYSVMIDRALFAILLSILLAVRVTRFEVYIYAYAFGKFVSLVFALYHFNDFLVSSCMPLVPTAEAAFESITVGSKLLIANLADMLILGIVRALIDANWGIQLFGKVSLAISLIGFFVTFMTQFSMVLYPALRQSSRADIVKSYHRLRSLMNIILPSIYLLFYPLSFILRVWLPAYSLSMHFLGILLPVCVFNSAMSICSTTYMKVLRREKCILILNSVAVIASALTAFIGLYLFSSIDIILITSVCVIALRYYASTIVLKRELGDGEGCSDIWLFTMSSVFLLLYIYLPGSLSFTYFATVYIVFIVCNKKFVIRDIFSVRSLLIDE